MTEPAFDDRRLSFGATASSYADHRPGYPPEALRWAFGQATPPVRRVADVGAGAGAMTRTLLALDLEVTAYEPDAGMLAELGERLPGVARHQAFAESLPAGDSSFDAAVVGQAWHWFDHGAASLELARVVRPGGALALVWNLRDVSVPWAADLAAIIGGEDSMQAPARPVRGADDYVVLSGPWSSPERAEFAHTVEMDADSLVGLVSTFSYVRLRPDADDVYSAVRGLVATHPDLRGAGRFALPYVTAVYRARRD